MKDVVSLESVPLFKANKDSNYLKRRIFKQLHD